MKSRHILKLANFFGCILILLSACGTFETAFEHPPGPTQATATLYTDKLASSKTTPAISPTPSPTTEPMTPTPSSTARPLPTTPTVTLLSPTPIPPPTPTVERIRFTSGATQATVKGELPANGSKVYVLGIAANQFVEMNATIGTMGQGLRFSVVGADGVVVKPMGEAHIRTVVPSTQDYYVELVSDVGATHYQMSVLIPARISFASGGTSTEIADNLSVNDARNYVLHALAGQRMAITLLATRGRVRLVISGVDGQVLLNGRVAGNSYDDIVTTTQDYLIAVLAEGETGADYKLEVAILAPLQILSFTAYPDPVERGGMVTLAWDAPGVVDVGITRLSEEGDIFLMTEALGLPATGSITLQVPENYVESIKYYLGARDVNGALYQAYVTVGIICRYGVHIAPRCPLTQDSIWAAYESFERGHMVWRGDTHEIYVLYDDGAYEYYEDTWQEGEPINIPSTPPAGLFAPVRGFGNLYANHPRVQGRLGWATAVEVGYTMTVETIPGGSGRYPGTSTFFTLPDNRVVNLYPFSATWQFLH